MRRGAATHVILGSILFHLNGFLLTTMLIICFICSVHALVCYSCPFGTGNREILSGKALAEYRVAHGRSTEFQLTTRVPHGCSRPYGVLQRRRSIPVQAQSQLLDAYSTAEAPTSIHTFFCRVSCQVYTIISYILEYL